MFLFRLPWSFCFCYGADAWGRRSFPRSPPTPPSVIEPNVGGGASTARYPRCGYAAEYVAALSHPRKFVRSEVGGFRHLVDSLPCAPPRPSLAVASTIALVLSRHAELHRAGISPLPGTPPTSCSRGRVRGYPIRRLNRGVRRHNASLFLSLSRWRSAVMLPATPE